jgi:Ca-activated chloride channel family protein
MMTIAFGDARMLWWLLAPGVLFVLWVWRLGRRSIDLKRLRARRVVPVRERFDGGAEMLSWLLLILAVAVLIVAVARPGLPTTLPQRAGLDVIVLQDASASMRVADMASVDLVTSAAAASLAPPIADTRPVTERWQRSMRMLRELGDALSWNSDRLAMIAFAHIATPQIRLTRDPNTLFFFLDHLHTQPPFRLEDDTTWDTNLEEAVSWGLRVVDKDREIHGRSPNPAIFVLLSDGEAWSGEVAKAVANSTARGIPLHVIGVGTLGGGPLPATRNVSGELLDSPGISRLERAGLQRIATAGQGEYFELSRDSDRAIANAIVAAGRRLAPPIGLREVSHDLYWWFLGGAALLAAAAFVLVRQVPEVAILLGGAVASAAMLAPILW